MQKIIALDELTRMSVNSVTDFDEIDNVVDSFGLYLDTNMVEEMRVAIWVRFKDSMKLRKRLDEGRKNGTFKIGEWLDTWQE